MPNNFDKEFIIAEILEDFWRYVFPSALPKKIIEGAISEITGLTTEELDKLKSIHFLLSEEVSNLILEMPKLLRSLSHSTQKQVIESRGAIKGRIDWNLTFKTRYSRGFNDPSLFICQPPSKMYDLPENQLLKFILQEIEKIAISIQEIEKISDEIIKAENKQNWVNNISWSYLKVKKILKNIYFQDINVPKVIRAKAVFKARNHRNKSYKCVVDCYELYQKIFYEYDERMLIKLIENQVLMPMDENRLYEIYVLFKILNNFSRDKLELGLLMPKKSYTARYIEEKREILVYYQKTPLELSLNSKYKQIFENYNLNVSSRMPDIILEYITESGSDYCIIEVKNTSKRDYIVDSVYKVLGYLNDFEKGLKTKNNPKAILIVYNGIKKINNINFNDHEVLIFKFNELNNLKKELELNEV